MKWRYEDGCLVYEFNGLRVVLKGRIEFRDYFADLYSLSPFIFWEWTEYKVEIKGRRKDEDVMVFFGDKQASYNCDYDYWFFIFRNYIGKSEIRIYVNGCRLPPLEIEVVSPKLSLNVEDELFYPTFCRRLIDSIVSYQLTLPLKITSPTYIHVEDVIRPPNLIVLFHQLMSNFDKIREGIQTILMNPHRELIGMETYVDLNEVAEVNPSSLTSILSDPSLLMKVDLEKSSLSRKLNGFLPRKILGTINVETYNNLENRFVKYFIRQVLHFMRQIEEMDVILEKRKEIDPEVNDKWRELKNTLNFALLNECFQEVDDLNFPIPFTSQVLLKRNGYRELLQVYNQLLLSRTPIFTYLKEKIDMRNIAELYEFWCFFELTERLSKFFRVNPKVIVETSLEGGLTSTKTKSIIGEYQLVYNKLFYGRGKESYSIPLKPDFSLMRKGEVLVLFDAKFRFDEKIQNSVEKSSLNTEEENALTRHEIMRMATINDILKMHAYRDALGAKASIILYPGNKSLFYLRRDGRRISDPEKIFEMICSFEEGVGYLAFIPKQLKETCKSSSI